MARIVVEDEPYEGDEDLGYQHSTQCYAKIVRVGKAYRSVVSRSRRGPWRWWIPSDRLLPGGPAMGQEA